MLERFYSFFGSLRLTFVLLCAAAMLVFIGTIAQVEMGLYEAQNRFFRSMVVYWGPAGADWKLPVLPGGYLVGALMILNLIAAHLRYFRGNKRQIGIALIHTGIVLLLLGQFATDFLQVESFMRLSEGTAKSYSESSRDNELAIIETTRAEHDSLVAVPQSRLSSGEVIRHPAMPLAIRVIECFVNSEPQFVTAEDPKGAATNGVGRRLRFVRRAPVTKLESRDVPAALIEVEADGKSLGTWWVSDWLTEPQLVQNIWRHADAATKPLLESPQAVTNGNRTFQLALRAARYYKPFSLELVKFSHDKYKGTEIPKNFSSRVRVQRPETGEDREILIYMNNPLRYAGETFYQSGYDENDPRVTILQVVRNPGWLTPYLACILVTGGLLFQFLKHLFGFAKNRRTA